MEELMRMMELKQQGFFCSQILLSMALQDRGESNPALIRAVRALGGGVECAARQGYHLREADMLFEIVDPQTGEPLPDGEYGEIVFTTLTRRGMPLIRYRTGDISRFLPGKCACGTALRRLEQVASGAFNSCTSTDWRI